MESGELVVDYDATQSVLGGLSDRCCFHLHAPEQKLHSLEAVWPLTSDSISLSFSLLPGKGVTRHGLYRD